MFAKRFVSSGCIISCMDQHVHLRKATWSCNCIQNKYSCEPIGWHEFPASYLHYVMEDHLTSKKNRECFPLDIFFKTRLGVSTEIRERSTIKKFLLPVPICSLLSVIFVFIVDLNDATGNGPALLWNYKHFANPRSEKKEKDIQGKGFRLRDWFCCGRKTSVVFPKLVFLSITLSVACAALNIQVNNNWLALSTINLMIWSALPGPRFSFFLSQERIWFKPGLNIFRGLQPMSIAPCVDKTNKHTHKQETCKDNHLTHYTLLIKLEVPLTILFHNYSFQWVLLHLIIRSGIEK